MRKLAALLAIVSLAVPAFPAARKTARAHTSTPQASSSKTTTSTKKNVSKKKTSSAKPAPSTKTNVSKKKTASSKAASSKKSRSSKRRPTRSKRTRQSWRTGQMAPAPERYAEIQQALIAKGYASGPATGTWNTQWADSLKRFQQDQNLPPTGKITSLSLMALGLGPKRDTAAVSGAVPAPAGDDPATNREPQ